MFADWAERFRVLGDATRLKILSLLAVRLRIG
jgi:DNA-binding transcriptional ArsR family regulator